MFKTELKLGFKSDEILCFFYLRKPLINHHFWIWLQLAQILKEKGRKYVLYL
jgi:hypothetical protein